MSLTLDLTEVAAYRDQADTQPSLEDQPLINTRFCVIDLETTGTSLDSRITEIAAVKVQGGQVRGEFQTLINPGVPIPRFITDLTGISNTTVTQAPRLQEVFATLVEFCRGCVMVAHNARFDMGFIRRAAIGLNYTWPNSFVLDTMTLAKRIIPRSEIKNYRLQSLAQFFNTPVQPTHRALDDVRATIDVLYGLLERVGNQGVATIEDLLAYSSTKPNTLRAKRVLASQLPVGPGVYCFLRETDTSRSHLYVGTSKQIRRRVTSYFTASQRRRRIDEMLQLATGVEAIECHTALEAAVVELRLITAHQPPYNRRSKNPHYKWIKLTTQPIPRFSIVHRILDDQASYCGPYSDRTSAELAVAALLEAFHLRTCTMRLSQNKPIQPCGLAELAFCSAPCSGHNLDSYQDQVDRARQCLAGDIRQVRSACYQAITNLSSQYRYEEAAEMLRRLQAIESGLYRYFRLTAVANCSQIVAARKLGESWEIHVFRYGQLANAGVARPGDDPQRQADILVSTAKTVLEPIAEAPAGRIEETELIAAWMELPAVRLINIDGTWGYPVNLS